MSMEREKFIYSTGEEFSVINFKAKNPTKSFLFFHATGFNALTYKIFLESLFKKFGKNINILAIDLRGHGMSLAKKDPELLSSWSIYVNDCIEWIDSLQGDLVLSGHSMGAIIASRLAHARPKKVKKLIMLEPVLFSPFNSYKFRLLSKIKGFSRSSDMINAASRRRYKFSSTKEIIDSYEGRGAFTTWSKPWIENYVAGGSKKETTGGIVLTCHPSWESKTFSTSAMDNWKYLRKISCPSYVASGGINSTLSRESRKSLMKLGNNWVLQYFPDATHFLPMEKTETLIDQIYEFVSK